MTTSQSGVCRRECKAPRARSAHFESGSVVASASPPAQSGPPHVTEPVAYDAVLLSSFGGPEGPEEVMPFLRNVTRGRGVPDERLEDVAHHYYAFGGVSPINEQNRELQKLLSAALAAAGLDLPVYWGNRNWSPYLHDALAQADADGVRRMLAIPTSAYSSYSSCRQYREDWADALETAGLQHKMQIDKVRQFFSHPGFVTPFIEGVQEAIMAARRAGHDRSAIEVLFSTHSIPSADAEIWAPGSSKMSMAEDMWRNISPSPSTSWRTRLPGSPGNWSTNPAQDHRRFPGWNRTSTMRSRRWKAAPQW